MKQEYLKSRNMNIEQEESTIKESKDSTMLKINSELSNKNILYFSQASYTDKIKGST